MIKSELQMGQLNYFNSHLCTLNVVFALNEDGGDGELTCTGQGLDFLLINHLCLSVAL